MFEVLLLLPFSLSLSIALSALTPSLTNSLSMSNHIPRRLLTRRTLQSPFIVAGAGAVSIVVVQPVVKHLVSLAKERLFASASRRVFFQRFRSSAFLRVASHSKQLTAAVHRADERTDRKMRRMLRANRSVHPRFHSGEAVPSTFLLLRRRLAFAAARLVFRISF